MFERYTERARRVLFFARLELSDLGGASIETEHLMLGLLSQGKGMIDALFTHWNVPRADFRRKLRDRIRIEATKLPTSTEVPFSEAAKRTLNYAAKEADRLQHKTIGAEHLLLGLLREDTCVPATMLLAQGMSLEDVRSHIVKLANESFVEESNETEMLPGAPVIIERITHLADQLAKAEPNSSEAQNALNLIYDELMTLRIFLDH